MNDTATQEAPATEHAGSAEVRTAKSIVPAKYAGRYRGGQNDDLGKFIEGQCRDKDGFSYDKFFELCLANGLPAEKVDHYRGQIADKKFGAPGRARMTLRNMLATLVRKDGKLVGLDNHPHEVHLAKPSATAA